MPDRSQRTQENNHRAWLCAVGVSTGLAAAPGLLSLSWDLGPWLTLLCSSHQGNITTAGAPQQHQPHQAAKSRGNPQQPQGIWEQEEKDLEAKLRPLGGEYNKYLKFSFLLSSACLVTGFKCPCAGVTSLSSSCLPGHVIHTLLFEGSPSNWNSMALTFILSTPCKFPEKNCYKDFSKKLGSLAAVNWT